MIEIPLAEVRRCGFRPFRARLLGEPLYFRESSTSEPSSAASAASAMAGVGLTMYLPGIDDNALLGGLDGAIFFVVFARDYNALTRLGYLLVSWVGSYYAEVEALGHGLAQTGGMAVFVVATLCVTGDIGMLEWMRGGELPNWMRGLLRRRGGRSGG